MNKARIKYYVFKDAIEKNERDVALEFEVYMRIIEDSDGNDVRVFVKEDKANGLRKDSSFYWDGSWEVFEFNDLANETRYMASSGIRSLRKYDDKKRLNERYMINGNGDTLTSELYEWKNSRLVRMTANGVARNYIYGKTLMDTVRVVPSDSGFNFHKGYDGTAAEIPEEGEIGYDIFAMGPYGHINFKNDDELSSLYFAAKNSVSENLGSLNVLNKTSTRGCVIEDKSIDTTKTWCVKFKREDIPNTANKNFGFPYENNRLIYGKSDVKLSLNFECQCGTSGKYQPSFSGKAINKKIEVHQSIWRYIDYYKLDWHELCLKEDSWQEIYNHEAKHIKNAIYMADSIARTAKKDSFNAKKECESAGKKEYEKMVDKWNEWYDREQRHINITKPESPKEPSKAYDEYPCY